MPLRSILHHPQRFSPRPWGSGFEEWAGKKKGRSSSLLSAAAWPAGKDAYANATCTPHHTAAEAELHSRDAGHTADQAASHLCRVDNSSSSSSERTEKISDTIGSIS